jgi:hypothetical protein
VSRAAGALLLALLVVHGVLYARVGELSEMLWVCHSATLLIALGLLFDRHAPVAVGFLFHLGMGWIGYVAAMLAGTDSANATSVLLHVLPLVFGGLAVKERGLPRFSMPLAWLLWAVLQPVSYFFTDPALNVNLVHRVWAPFAPLFPAQPAYVLFNACLAVPFLATADRAVRFALEARAPRPAVTS